MNELLLILMADEIKKKAEDVYYANLPYCTWKEAVDYVLNDLHLKLLSV